MGTVLLFFVVLFSAGQSLGQFEDFGWPVSEDTDSHGHMVSSQHDFAKDKPLSRGPDGDKVSQKPLIGRPDGHELTQLPLIRRPDGQEHTEFVGSPDELEYGDGVLAVKQDEHDSWDRDVIGKPDGHDWSDEEVSTEAGDADRDEPLVRCKRPLCMMYCSFGFQTDASGCPVCKCLEDPCQGVRCTDGNICHPLECKDIRSCSKLSAQCIPPSRNCPEPMCANYCPNGYAHNEEGCMTCTCQSEATPPEKVQDDPSACPEVMCAQFCPNGYQKNEHGCTTCTCITDSVEDSLCSGILCDIGQICRKDDSKSHCVPKPMCHLAQEMAQMKRDDPNIATVNMTRMFIPECEDDGAFKPLQCHALMSECWCIDDRGKEIDGTRTLDGMSQLHCEPNVTMFVHMHMMLTYHEGLKEDDKDDDDNGDRNDDNGDDNFLPKLDKAKSVLEDAFSSWLLVEKEFISVTKVEQSSETSVSVQLLVKGGGLVDLPSAVEHMKRKMRIGHCLVALENSQVEEEAYFSPVEETLSVEHQYSGDLVMTPQATIDDPFYGYGWYKYCFGNYHILLMVATMLLLFMMLVLFSALMVHRHRRNHRSLQFKHHKLENQLSHEHRIFMKDEMAIDAKSESTVVLVSADELEKKLPVA